MGIEKTEAIVINSRDWKETSKIVTFYTSSHGRLTGIAKGARRKTSSFRGCLEIFTYLNLVYYDRVGRDLQIVSQCSEEESFQDLREDLIKMAYASYFVQLVDEMVESKEPSQELFELLLAILYQLRANTNPDMLARFFEVHLLRILGYAPLLKSCAVCQDDISRARPRSSRRARVTRAVPQGRDGPRLIFSVSSGGTVCPRCAGSVADSVDISGGVYSALLHLQSVDIMKLSRFRLSPALSEELKTNIHCFLEYFLGKRVKSQEFLEKVILKL